MTTIVGWECGKSFVDLGKPGIVMVGFDPYGDVAQPGCGNAWRCFLTVYDIFSIYASCHSMWKFDFDVCSQKVYEWESFN